MCYFNFGLKTSSPGMVSISQSLFNSTLESRNSLFSGLLLFRKKKKKIRTLDEICNPSYTNLRSPRRFYNLIPKQAAKKGNSPGEKKQNTAPNFYLSGSTFTKISVKRQQARSEQYSKVTDRMVPLQQKSKYTQVSSLCRSPPRDSFWCNYQLKISILLYFSLKEERYFSAKNTDQCVHLNDCPAHCRWGNAIAKGAQLLVNCQYH